MSSRLQRGGPRAREPTAALDRLTTLAAVGVGAYMSALGGSIVNSTLPVIAAAFDSDVAQIEWVITAYLLVQGGLLLSFGRLGDLRGHKLIYVWGFVALLTSSALCGLAPSLGFLVGSRALQALGAAMLIANSPAILTHTFPPAQRGRVLGMQSTMVYLGLASGPPIGGWLADALGWRATFCANLPVGLLALALSLRFIPPAASSGRRESFDLAGAGAYVLGLTVLLLGLSQGHALGWTSPTVLGRIATGLVVLGVFAAIEPRVPSPMLDLGLFLLSRLGESTPLGFVAGAIFSTVLVGGPAGPAAVVNGVGVGLLVASVLAFVGALTSATRPGPEPTGERARRGY